MHENLNGEVYGLLRFPEGWEQLWRRGCCASMKPWDAVISSNAGSCKVPGHRALARR